MESFILAAKSLSPEEMARYCVPEKRRDVISDLQYTLGAVTLVSNYDIHTELISETEYTAEVFAEWYSRLETEFFDEGDVALCRMGDFGLDKRNGEWLIAAFETQDNKTDLGALQGAVNAFYYGAGGEFPTATGGAGDIDWSASDGAGHTFVPYYILSIPDSDSACDWHVTAGLKVTAANSCPCYNPVPDYPESCRIP